MLYFLNNILLAKNDDTDVWMQMLVYIVFAALWILGVISKKMKKKQQENDPQKQNKFEAKSSVQFENEKNIEQYARPVSRSKKIHQPTGNIVPQFRQTTNPSKIGHIEKLQSKIKKLETPVVAEIKKIPTKLTYAKHPKTQKSNYRQEIIAGLTTDTDSLKKAILYHEILGKPIGLRNIQ